MILFETVEVKPANSEPSIYKKLYRVLYALVTTYKTQYLTTNETPEGLEVYYYGTLILTIIPVETLEDHNLEPQM